MQMECFTVSASESTIPKLPEFYSLTSSMVRILTFSLQKLLWHVLYSLFFFSVTLSKPFCYYYPAGTLYVFCNVELSLYWHLELLKLYNFSVNFLKKKFFKESFYHIHANIIFLTLQICSSL